MTGERPNWNQLLARLNKLEKENTRIKYLTLSVLFLALCAVLVSHSLLAWYSSSRSKAWNSNALVATFDSVEMDEAGVLLFYYIVENKTGSDYTLEGEVRSLVRDRRGQRAISADYDWSSIDPPAFIPRKQRVRVSIKNTNFPDQDQPIVQSVRTKERIAALVQKHMSGTDGFVRLDPVSRYQIEFPRAW
jgi:hypothetical protein